ncbi:cell division protein ZapA [Desulforamulus hydrothermalis]|uniref:Cell division protein ZapA n=1 Tax=Desulforamulus hydrothermalis Lam5 = DSM 18033 TaxID=1121428 RepID=K8DXD0_9FIRM|nr:cell division protein ZapA [Desulforamulus hydrothermalis]CCO07262.1 Cell division protein ZapA [Desulforamulus hydrothermalis Lam5 = DSM 18033]SHG92597.1 cell division protein ZapA [Desulforamulus hydrothermalis Lam5 = DSM 18033]
MSDVTNRVEVEIFGEYYTLKGNESPEYMIKVAQIVDKKMYEISQRNTRLSANKLAVLTAVNLVDELLKLQEQYNNLLQMMDPANDNSGNS